MLLLLIALLMRPVAHDDLYLRVSAVVGCSPPSQNAPVYVTAVFKWIMCIFKCYVPDRWTLQNQQVHT